MHALVRFWMIASLATAVLAWCMKDTLPPPTALADLRGFAVQARAK
jgi:hypothetical protein